MKKREEKKGSDCLCYGGYQCFNLTICKDLKHILRKVFKNIDISENWDEVKSSLVKDGGRSHARVA